MLSFDRTRILPFSPGSYEAVHTLQRRLVDERAAGETPDAILLGEHERVITVGRGMKESAPSGLPIPVVEIERGGQATWHGPGQLVGYPILQLRDLGIGVRDYLRELEVSLIEALDSFGVEAEVREGATGVWVGERKIASIGVAVRRSVSYHGFALNVSPDLSDFALIQPCGFRPDVMTSLAQLLGDRTPSVPTVTLRVLQRLVARLRLAPPVWESEPAWDLGPN